MPSFLKKKSNRQHQASLNNTGEFGTRSSLPPKVVDRARGKRKKSLLFGGRHRSSSSVRTNCTGGSSSVQSSGSIHDINDVLGINSLDISLAEDLNIDVSDFNDVVLASEVYDQEPLEDERGVDLHLMERKGEPKVLQFSVSKSTVTPPNNSSSTGLEIVLDQSPSAEVVQPLHFSDDDGRNDVGSDDLEVNVTASPAKAEKAQRRIASRNHKRLRMLVTEVNEIRRERLTVEAGIEEISARISSMRAETSGGEVASQISTVQSGDKEKNTQEKSGVSWGKLLVGGVKSRHSAARQRDRLEYRMGIASIQMAALQRELAWLAEREALAEMEYRRMHRKIYGESIHGTIC